VDSALDGVVTMDDQGRIIAFNPAAEKIFGYRSDQVIGRTVANTLIPRKPQSDQDESLARFLATGRGELIGQRVEITAMRADGSTFPAEIGLVSVTPDKAQVFIAYIRDITRQKQAEDEQRQHALKIKKTLVQTILAISRTVEIRDPYTAGHQSRVAHLAATMAQALNLDPERVEGVFLGALIHDIGKIAVPAQILSRPGELMDEDKRYLQLHCQKGYEILEPVDFPWPVAEVAFQHHEHMDGSGYPQGLRGEEILLEARIVCVADVVESLTAHRPYRPAYPLREALQQITDKTGKWYDSRIVSACTDMFQKGYQISAIDMDELEWISSL
jgi:PAS domain S-box-containing protein/putative nucleotidyltransferase with HDIG domain